VGSNLFYPGCCTQQTEHSWTCLPCCRFPQLVTNCDVQFAPKKGGYCVCADHLAVPARYARQGGNTCSHQCEHAPMSSAVYITNRSGCPAGALHGRGVRIALHCNAMSVDQAARVAPRPRKPDPACCALQQTKHSSWHQARISRIQRGSQTVPEHRSLQQ
jgi:hypothetical protein